MYMIGNIILLRVEFTELTRDAIETNYQVYYHQKMRMSLMHAIVFL